MGTDKQSCRGYFIFPSCLGTPPSSPVRQSSCHHFGGEWGSHFTWDLTDCQRMVNSNALEVVVWIGLSQTKLLEGAQPRLSWGCSAAPPPLQSLPPMLPVPLPFVGLLAGWCAVQLCPRQGVLHNDQSLMHILYIFLLVQALRNFLGWKMSGHLWLHGGNSHISHLELSVKGSIEGRRYFFFLFLLWFQYSLHRFLLACYSCKMAALLPSSLEVVQFEEGFAVWFSCLYFIIIWESFLFTKCLWLNHKKTW